MFSREEIALLAQCERDMDSGKMPFVVLGGNRWGSSQEWRVLEGRGIDDSYPC